MYGSASGFRSNRHYYNGEEAEERDSWGSETEFERCRPRFSSPIMNPHIVPPSQHTLFMRGFNPNTEMNKIRDFFTKEGGKCSFDFFKVSQDGTRLFVALRFESKDVARDVLNRYDNTSVLGSKITITWFKDLRRARLKAMQHGQRWTNYYGNMKNGYNRGYGHKFGGGGKLKSTIWRQQNKGGDHSYQYMQDRRRKDRKHVNKDDRRRSSSSSRSHSYSRSRSRSHSRTKSRSHSRSRSRTRSRSWSHSRSRERSTSPSGRRYRTPSSSSSRGSSRLFTDRSKRRSWKGEPPFNQPEALINQPPDAAAAPDVSKQEAAQEDNDMVQKEEEINWENIPPLEGEDSIVKNAEAELMEIAQMQCGASPPIEKVVNDSESRSRSSSATDRSHSKDRKKKKKKHHRSKHRRHRHHRRHHHHPSSDEEGQVSEFEEGERSPTPDTHRRYRKRDRQSSSSSPDSPTRLAKRRNKAPQNANLNLSHLTDGISQHEELSLPPETPLESDGHSVKSLRSVDAPSQISDGMSPLHVSEGDDEVIAAQDKRDEPSTLENNVAANEDQVDSLSFLSSHLLNEENKEDNIGTAFGYSSVHSAGQNEIEHMENVVATNVEQSSGGGGIQPQAPPNEQAKSALRTKVGVATKSLLEKYKFSMKSTLSSASSSKEAASAAPKHVSSRQAGIAEEMFSTDTSPHNVEPPPPIARCFSPEIDMIGKEMPVKNSPIVVVAPPAIGANVEVRNSSPLVAAEDTAPSISTPTSLPGKFHIELSSLSCENIGDLGSAESSVASKKDGQSTNESLSKDKIQLIRRKRAEIEKAYRRDCQTFATVVKMLIRKDQTLDEKIQDSFRENLFDIGQQCIRDLQEFVEAILTSDD